MLCAPPRKPHQNGMDPHWLARGRCTDVEHPELGRSFRYATSKWLATGTAWSVGRRAPLLDEGTKSVLLPCERDLPAIDAAARPPDDASSTARGPRARPPCAAPCVLVIRISFRTGTFGRTPGQVHTLSRSIPFDDASTAPPTSTRTPPSGV